VERGGTVNDFIYGWKITYWLTTGESRTVIMDVKHDGPLREWYDEGVRLGELTHYTIEQV
jgi:hypothetical protein